jgi:hypothetical protein
MAFAGIIKEIHLVVNDFEIFWERQRGTRLLRQIRMFENAELYRPGVSTTAMPSVETKSMDLRSKRG